MELLHHGAVESVTGSCHELKITDSASLLIDCGLFQGAESAAKASQNVDFLHPGIQALVVTHAHIDHIGRIPYLVEAGFDRPIYCSRATAALLPIMLEDAIKIGMSPSRGALQAKLRAIKRLLKPLPYGRWTAIEGIPNSAFRLLPAGHILGSASVEVQIGAEPDGQRIVLSGDIGCRNTPLLPDPEPPEYADLLVLESTYGDRNHEDRSQRQQRMQAMVERCIANQGAILIPAFAVGRTQELLYELESIIAECKSQCQSRQSPWQDMVIILDSPLAEKVTATYQQWRSWWDEEATQREYSGRHPLDFSQLQVISKHDDHEATVGFIQRTAAPCIVLAGSGMCNGGRIQNYLKALLPDPRTDVLFVGYQAQGTLGAALQQKPQQVYIDNQAIAVKAQIETLGGYSAHADQQELLAYVGAMKQLPKEIRLVHGDSQAKKTLAQKLRERFGVQVTIGTA